MKIDILIYDDFDDLDALGPNEVLRHAANAGAPFEVSLVTLDGAELVTSNLGTKIVPDRRIADKPDILIVAGGLLYDDGRSTGVNAEIARGTIPSTIARLHGEGTAIASVCTGGLLLGASGLVNGRPATTNRGALEILGQQGAEVIDERVVDDGDILSSQGVTAGIDLALRLIEREQGAEFAAAVAKGVEYERNGKVWRREAAAA